MTPCLRSHKTSSALYSTGQSICVDWGRKKRSFPSDRMTASLITGKLLSAQSNILAKSTLKGKACFLCRVMFRGLLWQVPVRWKQWSLTFRAADFEDELPRSSKNYFVVLLSKINACFKQKISVMKRFHYSPQSFAFVCEIVGYVLRTTPNKTRFGVYVATDFILT